MRDGDSGDGWHSSAPPPEFIARPATIRIYSYYSPISKKKKNRLRYLELPNINLLINLSIDKQQKIRFACAADASMMCIISVSLSNKLSRFNFNDVTFYVKYRLIAVLFTYYSISSSHPHSFYLYTSAGGGSLLARKSKTEKKDLHIFAQDRTGERNTISPISHFPGAG